MSPTETIIHQNGEARHPGPKKILDQRVGGYGEDGKAEEKKAKKNHHGGVRVDGTSSPLELKMVDSSRSTQNLKRKDSSIAHRGFGAPGEGEKRVLGESKNKIQKKRRRPT